jgi:hypothetical protein
MTIPHASLQLRPEVLWFAEAMEQKLRDNDHKGKRSWRNDTPEELMKRMKQELQELEQIGNGTMLGAAIRVLERPQDPQHRATVAARILAEAADVANFAMMVADLCARDMRLPESPGSK